MLLSLEMRVSTQCPACSFRVHAPGMRTAWPCPQCGSEINFAAMQAEGRDGGLRYHFGAYYDQLAEAVLREDDVILDEGSNHRTRFYMRRTPPRCDGCEGAVDLRAAIDAIGKSFACGTCGDEIVVRAADDETAKWDPRITCVVGDAKGRDAREKQNEGTPVSCGKCGGPLTLDGKRRTVACTHCGHKNLLGDAVWMKLHPLPEARRFFAVYALDAGAQIALSRVLEKPARFDNDKEKAQRSAKAMQVYAAALDQHIEDLARNGVDTKEARKLVTDKRLYRHHTEALDVHLSPETRRKLANEHIGDFFAQLWMRSDDAELRATIAKNIYVGGEIIAHLSRDPQSAIRLHVAQRQSLNAALMHALAGDVESRVRAAIASRDDAPHELLKTLRNDPSPEVVSAVKANARYQPGFFEKLFG